MNINQTGQLLHQVYGQLNLYRSHLSALNQTSLHHHSSSSTVHGHAHPYSHQSSFYQNETNPYGLLLGAVKSLAFQLSTNISETLSPESVHNPMAYYYSDSVADTPTNSTWQNYLSKVIDSLPMPSDEASLNNELGLGPIRDPLWTAIPMTVLYVLILVTGVIGNVITCIVIARNRYMHTATNYYLFSLAISDLLLLVLGLPQEIQQIWQRYPYLFGEVFCVLRGFSSEASTNSSVLTITAFTMERYVAICHPLKAHTMSKLSRAVKLIVIIWLLGFLCAAPIAYQFGIVFDYMHDEMLIPQSATCNVKRQIPYMEEHTFALQSLLVFVIPVTLISVLYALIGVKLRQSSRNAQSDMGRNRRKPIRRQYSETWLNSSLECSEQTPPTTATTTLKLQPHPTQTPPTPPPPTPPTPIAHPNKSLSDTNPSFQSDNSTIKYAQVSDYRATRTEKYKSSVTSCASSSTAGHNSLAQRRAVIKMLSK